MSQRNTGFQNRQNNNDNNSNINNDTELLQNRSFTPGKNGHKIQVQLCKKAVKMETKYSAAVSGIPFIFRTSGTKIQPWDSKYHTREPLYFAHLRRSEDVLSVWLLSKFARDNSRLRQKKEVSFWILGSGLPKAPKVVTDVLAWTKMDAKHSVLEGS